MNYFEFGPVVQEKMSLKDISYLAGALAALLFCGAEPLVQVWYRVSRGQIL